MMFQPLKIAIKRFINQSTHVISTAFSTVGASIDKLRPSIAEFDEITPYLGLL